jgi:hypothetical protein
MTYILDSNTVYVVIQLHDDTILSTSVFAEYDVGIDYYDQLRIECDGGFDNIVFRECVII